jgi:hypothetical protein
MSINTGALAKASGIGAVIVLIVAVLGQVLNAVLGYAPGEVMRPEEIPGWYPAYSLCLSCVMYLLYAGYGAAYGWFAHRSGTPLDVGQYAIGGALAGIIVALVSSLITGVVLAVTGPALLESVQSGLPAGTPGGSSVMQTAMITGFIGGLCLVFVLGAGLGAAGAAVYAALARRNSQPTTV